MNQQKENIIINAKERPMLRNWIIRISDIRRILIHKKSDGDPACNTNYYIEVRYNTPDNCKPDDSIDILAYDDSIIVIMFYKIIDAIKRAKMKKYNDDYILIHENNVYLLSEVTIEGI